MIGDSLDSTSRRVIGIDESGKGDFFGPLVVAAFLASDADENALMSLGVRDSKTIAPKKCIRIADELKRDYPHALVVVGPEKYNQLYDKIKNLNKLLAWGHARAIENLLEQDQADLAISDKFGKTELIEDALMEKGREVELKQMVRGESIIQVAAASILARAEFIRQIDRLSEEFHLTVPRGASKQVDDIGRHLVASHGPQILDRVAKKHFKNYHRVVNPQLFSR